MRYSRDREDVLRVYYTGTIESDPYTTRSKSDVPYCKFTLSVSSFRGKSADTMTKVDDRHSCIAWGGMVPSCRDLKRGQAVYIEGVSKTKTWRDRFGVRHTGTSVWVNTIKLL